jgi:hypothetical protein
MKVHQVEVVADDVPKPFGADTNASYAITLLGSSQARMPLA